ncbi:ATP-binding cassette domain-containing protein [Aureliella helgolandensis]|uniref:Sulfate/thiosulfate import ATP-binding protein CysA n=1 Tax=Aureliella helgolandensis TaxID=2527968 RepID=A0A518GAC0_9BACT|nr:ATP-binding cassette domain-containing protein [Aureliella helgolandensis]QDV25509.1 Sulfate/thiosulfate import ATP-binding protein CysA [Aureliella helgolandensis]
MNQVLNGGKRTQPHLSFQAKLAYPSAFCLDIAFDTSSPVTALWGPSGSGKTTILSLIAGLLKPEQGRIQLGDRLLTDTQQGTQLPPELRQVGFLFQDQCLFPHMSVLANLQYGIRRQRNRTVPLDHIVEVLELQDFLKRSPTTLSGGQKQRVALARVLAATPQLLLLDEPLTSVEDALSTRIEDFIHRVIGEFQIPTILVSHNRPLVERFTQHIIAIEQGRLCD